MLLLLSPLSRFHPGRLRFTDGIAHADEAGVDVLGLLARHLRGDWGDLCDDDKAANEHALARDYRLLSAYLTTAGKVYIITEWDRSYTTVMMADEY